MLTDAEAQIEAQARAAASGLRDEVVALALMAAEKVSRRSLSDEDHRRLIEEAIDEADLSAVCHERRGLLERGRHARVSVAATYAEALFEAAEETGAVDEVAADVAAFAQAMRESAELREVLSSPESRLAPRRPPSPG